MKGVTIIFLVLCAGCIAKMNNKEFDHPTAEINQCFDAQRVLASVIEMLQLKNVTVHERSTESWYDSVSANIEHDHDLTLDIRPLQDVVNTFCTNANAYAPTQNTQINKPQEFIRKKAAQPSSSSEHKSSTGLTHQYQEAATRSHYKRSVHARRIRRGHQILSPKNTTQCWFSDLIQGSCSPPGYQEFTILFRPIDNLDDRGKDIVKEMSFTASSLSLVNIADPNLLRKLLESRTWKTVENLTIRSLAPISINHKPMSVDLGWLNEFCDLRNLSLQTFEKINNTGWKFVNKLESIEFQNLGKDVFWAANVLNKMDSLRYFTLKDGPIKKLNSSVFNGAPKIEEISIIQTAIEKIEQGTFNNLADLRSLTISDGKITDLPQQLFLQQANMRHLVINNNRLTRLMNLHFKGLGQLDSLHLNDNRISTIEKNTFAPLHQLRKLFLDGNGLTSLNTSLTTGLRDSSVHNHFSLHGLQHNLTYLWVSSNFELEIPDDLFLNLPNIEDVALLDCNISKLPQLIHLNHLRSFWIRNHDIDDIELSTSVPFENLQYLSMSRKPVSFPVKVSWGENATSSLLDKLRWFEAQNANMTDLSETFHKLNLSSLEVISLGWEGMNEDTFNMSNLCYALPAHIHYFKIQGSSYKHLTLCSGKDYDSLFLTDNKLLETLNIPGFPQQVNVSGCSNLQTLSVAEVGVLDISRTMLAPSEAWCSSWGTGTLIARDISKPQHHSLGSMFSLRILKRCFERISLLDISDNPWITGGDWINELGRRPVALSQNAVFNFNRQPVPFREAPPTVQIENTPVTCDLQFTWASRWMNNKILPLRHFFFICGCISGYTLDRNNNCVAKNVDISAIVVASVVGTLVVCGAFVFLVWQIFRFQNRGYRLQTEKAMSERLLEEREEEVLALKRVWEIDFHELQFRQKLASGGFGIVYKARWENMDVAIKVLKTDVAEVDDTTIQEFEKEVDFLQRTRHSCVVRFFGAGVNPRGARFLVLEYVALGSLQHILKQDLDSILKTYSLIKDAHNRDSHDDARLVDAYEENDLYIIDSRRDLSTRQGPISSVWELKLSLILDVAEGMAFIHSLDHIHRDLKSGNVLVTEALRGKITDFGSIKQCIKRSHAAGCSTTAIDCHNDLPYQSERGDTTMNFAATNCVGTPLYMAPEALACRSSTSKVDVFSYGVLLWEIAMQQRPDIIKQEKGPSYGGPLFYTILSLLEEGQRLRFPTEGCEGIPSWYRTLAQECMCGDPSERPSFDSIVPRLRTIFYVEKR